jgi:cell surface protein SprA
MQKNFSPKNNKPGWLPLSKVWLGVVLIVISTMIWGTVSAQDDKTARRQSNTTRPQGAPEDHIDDDDTAKPKKRKAEIKKQITIKEDSIPDSLLHPRWKIQRTMPITYDDLEQGSSDLNRPENLKQDVVYNDTLDRYVIGTKMGNTWVAAPVMMSVQEYQKWVEKQKLAEYFRSKNTEIYETKGKDKFSFTDMHFELGPAEKIFGPGGVRIKTQGSAELKFGATVKSIDNPSLPVRNRNTTSIDFDEKINLNVNGKVGDKVNMNLNYNTDATFDFDAQNMKLKYEGKEDEIIKLVEAGNVSFPSNSSLISGATSLFGLRTDMQFGKLKLQTVVSQKKSNSKSVSTKGGAQFTPFEIDVANYEENRHFFLSQYFRNIYDQALSKLPPPLTTGVNITRVEIWVTNKTGQTSNTRNIVALTDLGEGVPKNTIWGGGNESAVPSNDANTEYNTIVASYDKARNIEETATTLDAIPNFVGGVDYEKLEKARLLSSSEYTLNEALGYISLGTTLQTDQVLAVAFEYTYNGVTYRVGEFASDKTDVSQALFVKSLKNTSNNPQQGNWSLMMKNVYYLASSVEKDKFKLDIKFQSDTAGVYLNYLPELKNTPLLRVIGADRLDNNNKQNPNGYYDFVDGYTISKGRVFLPKVEPFGKSLYDYLVKKGLDPKQAEKYAYTELYDSTKTVAKQIAEKDKYLLQGQFKGTSANVISLGAYNVPQGSVKVTAAGATLTEGSDYSVDYSAGEVTILNQSIIDAGTAINVSLESNTDYGQQRKTMFGLNWEYDFTKDFQLSGTIQHLSEQSLTTKVQMGSEPLNNTIWGLNLSWKKDSQWLTNMLNKVPFLHVNQPSQIQFNGEFAQLIAGQASGTQDNASYIDDFEATKSGLDISTPTSWMLSSVPSMFKESSDKSGLTSGYNRARLAWYTIDPLFTRSSSSLTPSHIKSDAEQLSNHYVREIYTNEVFPNRDQSAYSGTSSTLSILNLAYYPQERGPYNFTTSLDHSGHLLQPANAWGGMMRKLDTNDFEAANIEYIEFWMLDPFIYTREEGTASQYGGDLYFNLGDISEDILRDGKKFYESGMPVDGSESFTKSQWGKIPTQSTVTYAFATTGGSRDKQDVGLNGLTDEEERSFPTYQDFIAFVNANVTDAAARDSILADPAADNYCYFRGSQHDERKASILERYKYINNPQGNSPESNSSFDSSYKTTPDVEDINQDYTLNEYEKYYQYKVSIRPEDLVVGTNYIVDKRSATRTLKNGKKAVVDWYQFRIPVKSPEREKIGSITDFTSIRFMRMFMTNFEKPIVLRFANLDLVRGEWRVYEQNLNPNSANTAQMAVSDVNIEENSEKTPVNYVLPPGITRVVDPSQPQLTESNESAMNFTLTSMSNGDAKAVYKNMTLDMRQYRNLQMFVHAHALEPNVTNLQDDQLALFIRLGSDYKSNYYEYEIPLKLTPAGKYSTYSGSDCRTVWPEDNMLNIKLSKLTDLKKARNKAKNVGAASYNAEFSAYDDDNPKNKISIKGNPTLGEVKTMVIGVRNLANTEKSGEVWINELRLLDPESSGGWAAQGNLNVQLSDFGSVNASGRYTSEGFGGLEEGVASRSTDNYSTYSVTTSLELGKFFPEKAKVQAPLYYSVTRERTAPKFNPLDTDMKLDDALDAASEKDRDYIESIAVKKDVTTNFSLSGVRFGIATKRHPMPYDPANFTFSYSHSHSNSTGETTVYENEDNWKGGLSYSWTPVYKSFEPFKKIKSKAKSYDILKRFSLNWLPQNISFNSDLLRDLHELQERDLEDLGAENSIPLSQSTKFSWNRDFSIRWDLTKNLHLNFQSATNAEIEQPFVKIDDSYYLDEYSKWKDEVKQSIYHMGTPLDYQQSFTASYKLPINLIPVFNWISADANYTSNYNWQRGGEPDEDGTFYGNTISMNRQFKLNSNFNMEKLYDQVPFLKKTNERFRKAVKRVPKKSKNESAKSNVDKEKDKDKNVKGKDKAKDAKELAAEKKEREQKERDEKKAEAEKKKQLALNRNRYEKEVTIKADTSFVLTHGKKSRNLTVTARNAEGKLIPVKYKVMDDNRIRIINKADSAVTMKVTVMTKPKKEDLQWYRLAQSATRFLMMVRNVSFTYSNQYSMSLPGFKPYAGDVFGQNNEHCTKGGDAFAPGLGFAFGFVGDDYINRANDNGWLLNDTSVATPAATSKTEDLNIKATLEPARNLKIDLTAARTMTQARTVQYMYNGNPTNLSGQFTMTTISIRSAFEGMGSAENGFRSASFDRFRNSIEHYRSRVEAQYKGAVYPSGAGKYAGQPFNPNIEVTTTPIQTSQPAVDGASVDYSNAATQTPVTQKLSTGVNPYSADVLVPAFLHSYTGYSGLGIFPAITSMLPNWSIRYSGLSNMTFFQNLFKSVNINHSYKSVYAVGSYSSYSTYMEYMGDGLGFILDGTSGTNVPVPSSMYNVSQVSINEKFSPLLGVDVTMRNNMTVKLEYSTTRVLSLSMTSVQINEALSKDFVIGCGYKINDFSFSGRNRRLVKSRSNGSGNNEEENNRSKSTSKNSKKSFNHDLNLRLDLSLRNQASITRDIREGASSASSGNKAFKLNFSAEYTVSKLLKTALYYNSQTNAPLLTSSSYPTTTHDFGVSMQFSLTR